MTTIRLLDARRALNRKCEELFGDAKIAESIYRFLCDGIEECEDAEPERKWIPVTEQLPEEGDEVLVTVEGWDHGKLFERDVDYAYVNKMDGYIKCLSSMFAGSF